MRKRCDHVFVNLKCLYKEAKLGKNHYSQGKRMREIAKKQKQEEKKERKLARQNPQPGENAEDGTDSRRCRCVCGSGSGSGCDRSSSSSEGLGRDCPGITAARYDVIYLTR